jgi:hypothetical protein
MRHALIRVGTVLLILAVGASCSDDDESSTADPAAAPVEFTACVHPGPSVHTGTEELSQVSLPDGEMTITRGRGTTWRLQVSDVSDPRLDGAWYVSIDGDEYTLPQGGPGPSVATWTFRIETDEGAWQGSFVGVGVPGLETVGAQYALIGEGAYEGLTAVAVDLADDCPDPRNPNTRGYIIEGGVPAPPVPQTDR